MDAAVCRSHGTDPVSVAAACFRGGARILQLRFKSGPSAEFVELGLAIAADARRHGASLIINDRVDVCRLTGASGVHVGQDDMPVAQVRLVAGADAIVGLSTHDDGQIEQALGERIDYVAVGPIYETSTKGTGLEPAGLDLVRKAAGRGRPVVAIGGITLDRLASVIEAGASSVAVISDLFVGADPEARTRAYLGAAARAAAGRRL